MKALRRSAALFALFALFAAGAVAAQEAASPPPAGDPRIQTMLYDPEQVFELRVAPGFVLTLALGGDERVENVIVGNSAAWQVVANRRADHVSVKPTRDAIETNMTVITDARRYSFLLRPAFDAASSMFEVRFRYASVPADVETIVPPRQPTFYKVSGDRLLRPGAMADDGERTTIRWPADVALPAVYAIDERGRESVVNGRMIDGSYVVEAIAARFRFRRDDRQATAVRRVARERSR